MITECSKSFFFSLVASLCKITNKINLRIKKLVVFLCGLFFILLLWNHKIYSFISYREIVQCILIALVTVIYVFITLTDDFTSVLFSKKKICFSCLLFISLVIGVFFSVIDNLLFPFVICIFFPILHFFSYNKTRSFPVVEYLAMGMLSSFILFIVVSIFLSQNLSGFQFTGVFSNANLTSEYVSVMYVLTLFLLLSRKRKLPYLFCLSMELSVVLLNASRTGFICVFVSSIVLVLYLNLTHKTSPLNILLCIVLVFVMGLAFLLFFVKVNFLFEEVIPYQYLLIPDDRLSAFDLYAIKDMRINSISQVVNRFCVRLTKFKLFELDKPSSTSLSTNKYVYQAVDYYSSGRIEIFSKYLKKLSFLGHEIQPDLRPDNSKTAHNVYLQIAYDYGIIQGVLYGLFVLYIFMQSIYSLIKERTNESVFFFLCVLTYGITSLLSSCVFPFEYFSAFVFFFFISLIKPENEVIIKS